MFSRSKRFIEKAPSTPAVGQYDVSKKVESAGGAVLFPKDKRFKDKVTNGHDTNCLDISNCSTISTKSSGSIASNHSVFATPRKPCGKSKSVVLSSSTSLTDLPGKIQFPQPVCSEDENKGLTEKIAKLQVEVERLRCENEKLQKVPDNDTDLVSRDVLNARIVALVQDVERLQGENKMLNIKLSELKITVQERQILESNLATLNGEMEKLKREIEEEILRNKELLFEQTKYECSLETMQADLELANSQVTALRGQIVSLEQHNADISESREDLENQCTQLHGITISLQQDKLTLHDRLEDIKNVCKNINASKEYLEKQLSSCQEEYKTQVNSLETSLSEKMAALSELNEQRESMEETINVYKNRIEELQQEVDESFDVQKKINDEMKILRVEKETLVVSIKYLEEKHVNVVNEAQQEMSHLRDETRRKEAQSLQSLQNLTRKCEMLEDQLAVLQKGRDTEVESLQRELELSKTSLYNSQEEYKTINQAFKDMKNDYDIECQNRLQLEQDFHTTKGNMMKVSEELTEAQENVSILRECEKEQRITKEMLSTKLEECKLTVDDLEKVNAENQNVIKQNNSYIEEIEKLKELLAKVRDENRSLTAAEEKTNKLKQEYGRRLVETQKQLSQKEMDLQSCEKELEEYALKFEGQESWKRKFEELEERIAPFQEQLNAYEFEKQTLLNQNSESQSEIEKLGQQYAKLLGHQNQKQKIRHVIKLKEENASLKKEVAKLREESNKQKQSMKRLEEKYHKVTGVKRFDPSLAFQNNVVENKENTPLKTRQK